jgi:hypothetical protein
VAAVAFGLASGARAAPCAYPAERPLWVDFANGSVRFREPMFGKPGLVVAGSGYSVPKRLRLLGAQSAYWEMRLPRLAGTPANPLDPALVPGLANDLVNRAIDSTGCDNPAIALNELWGVWMRTPWSEATARYRANVLTLMQVVASRGAVAYLLVPGNEGRPKAPFTGDAAADWWRQAAQAGHLVRELHFNAPAVSLRGVLLGSRQRRIAMRRAVATFTDLGIPPERIGLNIAFQSGAGKGGREGLRPREEWLAVVKRETLAVRQVASELPISSIWSWGWGTFGPGSEDPDKVLAACVYLWVRNPAWCNAPFVAGPAFDSSLTAGQIRLPAGVHCDLGGGVTIPTSELDELVAATRDRRAAVNALAARAFQTAEFGSPEPADLDAVLLRVVERSFGGNADAFRAELAAKGVTEAAARGLVADELRRETGRAQLSVGGSGDSLDLWTARQVNRALRTAICLRDELPDTAALDGLGRLPFLRLPEPAATLEAGETPVVFGDGLELSGRVTSDRATERITVVEIGFDRTRRTVVTVPVAADGTWSAFVSPRVRTTYVALAKGAASPPLVVAVTPRVELATDLSVRVRPALPGAVVWLQSWSGDRWSTVARARLGRSSRARFEWDAPAGNHRLRAVVARGQAGDGLAEGSSDELRYVAG